MTPKITIALDHPIISTNAREEAALRSLAAAQDAKLRAIWSAAQLRANNLIIDAFMARIKK